MGNPTRHKWKCLSSTSVEEVPVEYGTLCAFEPSNSNFVLRDDSDTEDYHKRLLDLTILLFTG